MAKKCIQNARFLRIVLAIVHPIPKVSLVTIGRPCFCADVAPCPVVLRLAKGSRPGLADPTDPQFTIRNKIYRLPVL
jgi:hypothetical protein